MSFLADLLADVLVDRDGPSTPRGLLVLALAVGAVLCGTNGWLAATSPDPLREPAWGIPAILGAFVLGPAGALLAALHLSRENDRRGLAWPTLVINILAVVFAMAAIF